MKKIFFIACLISSITAHAQTATECAVDKYFATIKKDPAKLNLFLKTMPKGGDLHNHLGGAGLAENLIHYAKNDPFFINYRTFSVVMNATACSAITLKNLTLYPTLYNATIDAWSMRNFYPKKESGHDHFFAAFDKYNPLARRHSGEILNEVVKGAREQNILYLELMITPDHDASGMLGGRIGWNPDLARLRKVLLEHGLKNTVLDMSKQLDATEATLHCAFMCKTPKENLGRDVKVRYLYQVFREQPAVQVFAQLLAGFELASRDARVLGINIVQAEDGKIATRDYTLHMCMIRFLRHLYPKVHVSLHAGELVPGLVPANDLRFHIREALNIAQADRIGHGVDIRHEDDMEELLKKMAEKHVLVEINLSSNEAILNVKGKTHPILLYMRHRVPVALSTDDAGVLRTNLTEEYRKAVLNYHFSYSTLKMLVRNSINYSFVPGNSLWKDHQYHWLVPVCATSLGSSFVSIQCQNFLKTSEKARLQWTLENQFLTFERKAMA